MPVNHTLVPWLVQQTCVLFKAGAKGQDGLIAWEKVIGRALNQLLWGFDE